MYGTDYTDSLSRRYPENDCAASYYVSYINGDDRDYLEGRQDIHEADILFQKRVRQMYLKQCSLDESFIRIDCSDSEGNMLPPDEIFSRIKTVVDKAISSK